MDCVVKSDGDTITVAEEDTKYNAVIDADVVKEAKMYPLTCTANLCRYRLDTRSYYPRAACNRACVDDDLATYHFRKTLSGKGR